NVITFFLLGLDAFLRSRKKSSFPELVCLFPVAAGGSLGALLAEFLWDRTPVHGADTAQAKARRDTVLTRWVLSSLFLILHLFLYLVLTGTLRLDGWHLPQLTPNGILFLKGYGLFLLIINLYSFVLFGIDKRRAVQGKRRISIQALFVVSLGGGTLGALCGMRIFRHKTQKLYFRYGLWLLLIVQLITAVLLFPMLERLR
ncbi:membrane protein containing DUF1294, partial [gut metagenome]